METSYPCSQHALEATDRTGNNHAIYSGLMDFLYVSTDFLYVWLSFCSMSWFSLTDYLRQLGGTVSADMGIDKTLIFAHTYNLAFTLLSLINS